LVSKKAFTLIEVMVAVLIVSLVIGAMIKMRGDMNHIFIKMQENQNSIQYATFLLWNKKYSLDNSHTTLYNLLDEFDLDDNLRRKLKEQKVDVEYKRLEDIELEMNVFEIGRTRLRGSDFALEFERVRLQ
jgi:prepilin-type N-terminal cleavage/methylation domain-containing protein